MERSFWKRAAWETGKTVFFVTVFSLVALAIAAVFVRAYCPPQAVVTTINWVIKCVGIFAFSLLCIRRERAFFKGLAAGVLSVVFTMFLFAIIGGGFSVDIFFLVELVVCAALGGLGALWGAILRKA